MRYLYVLMILLGACRAPDYREEKLALINRALEKSYLEARIRTIEVIDERKRWETKVGGTPEETALLKKCNNLHQHTLKVLHKTNEIKQKIYPKAPQEAEKLMLDENKNGLAYSLKKDLDEFVIFLLKEFKDLGVVKEALPSLTENNLIYKNSNHQKLDFAQANFQNMPVMAMLATLTRLQTDVVHYEQEIIKKSKLFDYNNHTGASFSRNWFVEASSNTDVVVEGEEYIAELGLFKKYSDLPIHLKKVSHQGFPVPISYLGYGFWEMIPPAQGKQSLNFSFTFDWRCVDTTMQASSTYYVIPNSVIKK